MFRFTVQISKRFLIITNTTKLRFTCKKDGKEVTTLYLNCRKCRFDPRFENSNVGLHLYKSVNLMSARVHAISNANL